MNYMKDELFFDTNIIVYAYDKSEIDKQKICSELVEKVFKGEIIGAISNQVLGELFIGLTQKIEKPISIDDAEILIKGIIQSENWVKINYDVETIKTALITIKQKKVPFWDAVIAETMKENGIFKIYTENEKDFRKVHEIKTVNPLKKLR